MESAVYYHQVIGGETRPLLSSSKIMIKIHPYKNPESSPYATILAPKFKFLNREGFVPFLVRKGTVIVCMHGKCAMHY